MVPCKWYNTWFRTDIQKIVRSLFYTSLSELTCKQLNVHVHRWYDLVHIHQQTMIFVCIMVQRKLYGVNEMEDLVSHMLLNNKAFDCSRYVESYITHGVFNICPIYIHVGRPWYLYLQTKGSLCQWNGRPGVPHAIEQW